MNKNKIIYLGMVIATLFGCNNNVASSSNSSIKNSSSIVSTESSSSSQVPLNYELEDEMLHELKDGYQVLGIYTSTIKDTVTATNYYSYNCTDTVYEFTSWEEVKSNPTRENIASSYRYEGYTYGGKVAYLTQAKLTLNNEVVNYLVTDGYGNLLTWDSTGFGNVFGELSSEDFTKTENDFEFELNMNKLNYSSIYQALTSQFSSYMGLTMTSFKIKTDGQKLKSYFMDFAPLITLSGQMYITVEGEFTKMGSDVTQPLKPYTGIEDEKFDEMFELLQQQNYRLDVNLGVKSYKMSLENAQKLVYDEYDKNGVKVNSYGYYQLTDSLLQGVTKINDVIYANGSPVSGSLWNIIPTLEISSVLFDLVAEESNDQKSVFTLREDVSSDIAMYYDYGMMATSVVGDLKITIEDEKVTIVNKLSKSEEEFIYYDIGKVKNSFSSLKKTCDELKWSDLLSNQVSNFEKLCSLIPQEALDLIPTYGGLYSYVEVNPSYKPKVPVLLIPMNGYDDGLTIYSNYVNKLLLAGFEKNEANSSDALEAYTKDCVIDGVAKKLCVKIYCNEENLSGTQFVIFPSIIE